MNRTDPELRSWRIRAALRLGEWETAIAWIETLPEEEGETEVWRYWLARALEIRGDTTRARSLYMNLSKERSYYGFLAADRLGIPYRFSNRPIKVSAADLEALKKTSRHYPHPASCSA